MKAKTRDIILSLASKDFTFYAPLAHALGVKGKTAEKHLKALAKEGLLIMKDDGEHARTFELSPSARASLGL